MCWTPDQQEIMRKKERNEQEEKKLDDMYVDINTAVLVKMRELEGKDLNVGRREKASYLRVGIRYGEYLEAQRKKKQPSVLSRMVHALSPGRRSRRNSS